VKDLKKLIEVKLRPQYPTPVKEIGRPNNSGCKWRKEEWLEKTQVDD